MDKQNAALLLNLELPCDEEEVKEKVEEKVFELRDFFLRQAIHPVLFAGRRERLRSLLKAQEAILELSPVVFDEIDQCTWEHSSFKNLLQQYSQELMQLRLRVSASLLPEVLIPLVNQMIQLQETFEENFLQLGKDLPEVAAPKQTEAIALGQVIYKLNLQEDVEFELAREKARILSRRKGGKT
jgi:hypothetical protein